MKTTFIYAIYSESDKQIRYVGKSNNPTNRLKRHIYQRYDSNTYKNNWLKKVIDNGETLSCKILEEVSVVDWPNKEKYWISQFDNLTNTACGGLGGSGKTYTISYLDCKKWVADNLVLKSKNMWYSSISKLPEFIPKNPREAFLEYGWISWGDFLGTGRVQDNIKIDYISYPDAKEWIKKNNIICSSKEWKNLILPSFLPRRPERYYKNRGWIDWSDFLSNNVVQNQKKKFLTYDECVLWLRNSEYVIDTHTDWKKHRASFPKFIPSNPNIHYKTKGSWITWNKFFEEI